MKANKVIVCPKCGKVNTLDSKFCVDCGETLDPSTAISMQPPLQPVNQYQLMTENEKKQLFFYLKKISSSLFVIELFVIIYFALSILAALLLTSNSKLL